ncbi:hypothetical protein GDO78_017486 [Eleutherodactylus coqui]|uniref:Uncharacterized protein n=1 Tax=Eleutherodactylus coqui TaxID=57060 RepID=A0A8J6BF14_ELECQ|nr:hypothetical protein GDO78_017486 [Eleutherodactylus coqui]
MACGLTVAPNRLQPWDRVPIFCLAPILHSLPTMTDSIFTDPSLFACFRRNLFGPSPCSQHMGTVLTPVMPNRGLLQVPGQSFYSRPRLLSSS